jgi:hypothetical protein
MPLAVMSKPAKRLDELLSEGGRGGHA